MRFILTLFAGMSVTVAAPAVARTEDRPNIVIAFADDWGRYASVYARLEPGGDNDLIRTPNFDSLAARGVLFTRAFVNAPRVRPVAVHCSPVSISGEPVAERFCREPSGMIKSPRIESSMISSACPISRRRFRRHVDSRYPM